MLAMTTTPATTVADASPAALPVRAATPSTGTDAPALRPYALADNLDAVTGTVFLTGTQALVRVLLMQRRLDEAAGLRTAGFVSGYRGSPLGMVDQQLWKAKARLDAANIRFLPAINEDLAATACLGVQRVALDPLRTVDGVHALWYGKGPGVDRSGDALKHGNVYGSSPLGGVLVVAGDDHGCVSSSMPHQSDLAMQAWSMPVLHPANVAEYLEFGLYGWALSRATGAWVGFKAISEVVESGMTVDLDAVPIDFDAPSASISPHRSDAPDRPDTRHAPNAPAMKASPLHVRAVDLPSLELEARLALKLDAVRAFAARHSVDKHIVVSPRATLGIVTVGKAHFDFMEVLRRLELDPNALAAAGVRVYKAGLVFPLEPTRMLDFARGLEEVLVIEEKAPVVERQLKELLYGLPDAQRPRISGKTSAGARPAGLSAFAEFDVGHGNAWPAGVLADSAGTGADVGADVGAGAVDDALELPLLSALGELRPSRVMPVVAAWLARLNPALDRRRLVVDFTMPELLHNEADEVKRQPYFCSGCPHNTSTKVPEGSRALAGIGCHFMASWMERGTSGLIQMGAEGVDWAAQSRFTTQAHVFQNLGDGTYFHSGLLAIRQAIAAGANITYKLLYNDAVAMTGGQPVDGQIGVAEVARQVQAEGAKRVVVVSDDIAAYRGREGEFPAGTTFHARSEMDAVQRQLREVPGVTLLIYEQTCPPGLRCPPKKGEVPDRTTRIVINERVCEGCGDCGQASNCLSVIPVETDWGRKRAIEQSSCNKDYSCVDGFCPSFVSVEGAVLRKRATTSSGDASGRAAAASLSSVASVSAAAPAASVASVASTASARSTPPEPSTPNSTLAHLVDEAALLPAPPAWRWTGPFDMLVTGVGGTGVVTVGALVTMAAHLEHKQSSVLDFMGFAQKGGAVLSFVRLALTPDQLNQVRIDTQQADILLACDMVVGASTDALGTVKHGRTVVVANTHEIATAAFVRDPDASLRPAALLRKLRHACGSDRLHTLDAQALAQRHFGDTLPANIVMLGAAYQHGYVPLSETALCRAIELNGVAVASNLAAFAVGRLAVAAPKVLARAAGTPSTHAPNRELLGDGGLLARRMAFLEQYQDAAYAQRLDTLVQRVITAERSVMGPAAPLELARAVTFNHAKLLAIKDEYEVARLYTDGSFTEALTTQFESWRGLKLHLAPPLLARRKPDGTPIKTTFGPWILKAMKPLARARRLRGTVWDIFGRTDERRMERALIGEYEAIVDELLQRLKPGNHAQAVTIARVPERIRGFGHVKLANVTAARATWAGLMAAWRGESVVAVVDTRH
jgi:indolepyruvate ferredoxin oxidoreductase